MKTYVENNVQFWSERHSVQWLQPVSNIKHLHGDKMAWRLDVSQ